MCMAISLCSIGSLFGKPVNTDDSPSTFGSAGVGALERIWSISRMPVCEDKSHEEFRWEDYQLGNRGGEASTLQSMSSMLVSEDKSHEELRWEYYQFRSIIDRGDFYELVALPLYEMQVASVVQQAFLVRIIWDGLFRHSFPSLFIFCHLKLSNKHLDLNWEANDILLFTQSSAGTQMSIHRGGAAPWIQYGLSTMPLM
ncbi:hypothetical protein DVH24_008381 [Malus domestica]|uniref:Uncharacterized protein n=1 Tax=Malus domestica TaxID=3750 RepID=A0A498JRK4_MALDO|nr:hypothetical protein DVH24_008381 [Malus domestica]